MGVDIISPQHLIVVRLLPIIYILVRAVFHHGSARHADGFRASVAAQKTVCCAPTDQVRQNPDVSCRGQLPRIEWGLKNQSRQVQDWLASSMRNEKVKKA
jgi:hypothetical protein